MCNIISKIIILRSHINIFFVFLLFLLISFQALGQTSKNLEDLPLKLQKLHIEIESILDELEGEYLQSELLGKKIDSFLSEEKDFLPVHIAKVRHIIDSGYIGTNDIHDHLKQAQLILDELIINAPSFSESYYYQGIVQMNLLHYEEAEKAFTNAKNLDPKNPWVFKSLGRLKYRQKNYLPALEYYKTAFDLSSNEWKSLALSFIRIVDISMKLNQQLPDIDFTEFVFKNFKDRKDRLKIAKKLITVNIGKNEIIEFANKIIIRQKGLTPDCIPCDIETANIKLTSGFKYLKNNIKFYNTESMDSAEKLLNLYKDDSEVNEKVYKMLIDISFSKKNLEQVEQLLSEAQSKNISEKLIKLNQALVHYLNRDYKSVIEIFEYLIEEDKGLLHNKMYLSAKGRFGKITHGTFEDYDYLEQYYLRQIDRYPDNAYVYGNYVSFLLGYVKRDSAAAIVYGEKGMQYMSYGLLRNDLGLAYHIEASKLSYTMSNRREKIALFKKSLSMGDKDYSKDNRCTVCTSYPTVKKLLSGNIKVKAAKPPDYFPHIRWVLSLLLISLMVIYLKEKLMIIIRK